MKCLISTLVVLTFSFLSNVYATEVDQHETLLSSALQKFSTESQDLKSTLKNSYIHRHPDINTIFNFYLSMVLMHVRYQDYAQSYLDGRVCWYHVIGLALAFEAYRTHATISDGVFSQNNHFLTQVLELYHKM